MEKEKQKQERSAMNSNSAESHVQNNNLRCPRCDSSNTKFCYYNNYNLTQPRHFCKTCRRYWTKGGALRNVPIGGGCRKNRKTKQKSTNKSQTVFQNQNDGYQLVASESAFSAPCSSSSLSFLWTTPMCGPSPKLHNLNTNSLQNHLIPIEKIPTLFDTFAFPTQTIMNPLSIHHFSSSSSTLGSELTMQALGCSDWNWRAHNHQQQEQERLQELSIATYNQEGEPISSTTSDNNFVVLCHGKSNIGLDNNFAGPQQTQQVIPQGVLELKNDALVLPQSTSTGNYWQSNDRQPLM